MNAIDTVAKNLSIPSEWLQNLIKFESSNNPQAKNKISGARGLIQFLHSTAKSLGFNNADDLVNKYPDFESQLLNPVQKYLNQFKPFPTKQSLYMAVFYPAARTWPVSKEFPDNVKKSNPGIVTVSDYINKVERKKSIPAAAIISAALLLFFFLKDRKSNGRKRIN
jgi:hypothetical protein